jgi:ATP-dependent Clp protease ATP-binding subunit ClpC
METTPRCLRALNSARESISRFGHSHVTSAHLVLGLLMFRGGVVVDALRQSGLSSQSVENYLALRRSPTEETVIKDDVAIGKSALLCFERAETEARMRSHPTLGTEHLMLGILKEQEGEAVDLFAAFHADKNKIWQMISAEIP